MTPKAQLKDLVIQAQTQGPLGQRQDAQTILEMWDELSQQAAQIYLDRFCRKWRLESQELAQAPTHVRRRPMQQLERAVYMELLLRLPEAANDQQERPSDNDAVELTIEDSEDRHSA